MQTRNPMKPYSVVITLINMYINYLSFVLSILLATIIKFMS